MLVLRQVVHVIYRVKYRPGTLRARPKRILFKSRLGVMYRWHM